MLLIIALVVASIAYVVFDVTTKPLLQRDLNYLEDRNERQYQAAKAAMSAK